MVADFICYRNDYLDSPLVTRLEQDVPRVPLGGEEFPRDTLGINVWRELVEWLQSNREFTPSEIRERLSQLRNQGITDTQPLVCPRLFISHRSVDAPYALAIGKIAKLAGFDIWIDVLDPVLSFISGQPTTTQNAVATAMIVEMALLNCSHLLAVMTAHTHGSWWVPYEYGRIKERYLQSSNVAAWFDSTYPRQSSVPPTSTVVIPEYLCLGEQLRSKQMIMNWLQLELTQWKRYYPGRRCEAAEWPYAEPISIP